MPRSLRLAALAALLAGPALAEEPLAGGAIAALVAGNTIEGTMTASGPYAEFYAEDGTIRGKDYTGAWTVEADTMCFQYGSDPKDCWQVGQAGEEVLWIRGGEVLGTGRLRAGNPNGF